MSRLWSSGYRCSLYGIGLLCVTLIIGLQEVWIWARSAPLPIGLFELIRLKLASGIVCMDIIKNRRLQYALNKGVSIC